MCLRSLRRKILRIHRQQPRNRGESRENKSRARHATTFQHQRNSTSDWENSCVEPLCLQIQRQMLAILSCSKKAFHWDAQCKEAFSALKTYLSSPLILVSPFEEDRVQQPVYYCSRALRVADERYSKMEKLVLALVTTARRLRPYFQAHTIKIPIEHPMKQVLHKQETSGRLTKWP